MTAQDGNGFIDIINRLSVIKPISRSDLIKRIEATIANSLVRKIDSHNTASVLFVFQNPEVLSSPSPAYVLKAEFGNDTATEKEIDWYAQCATSKFIPKQLASSRTETHSLLLMEYVESAQTLDSLNDEDDGVILAYYKDAIEFDRKLHYESTPRKSTLDEMDAFYTNKFNQRFHESLQFNYLAQLFVANRHIINGKQYHSPSYYIDKINQSTMLRSSLMPQELGFVHGDLHGGNILIANHQVTLVDPNGNRELPLEYDFGKILHTVHGGYRAIMDESYILQKDGEQFIFEISTSRPGLYTGIKKFMNDSELLRGLYAEAMHFTTMLPHHASNERETTALFLRRPAQRSNN